MKNNEISLSINRSQTGPSSPLHISILITQNHMSDSDFIDALIVSVVT